MFGTFRKKIAVDNDFNLKCGGYKQNLVARGSLQLAFKYFCKNISHINIDQKKQGAWSLPYILRVPKRERAEFVVIPSSHRGFQV